MERILEIHALGIQSAKLTAKQIYEHFLKESGNCLNRKRLAAFAGCLNDELKNELLKLI